MSESDDAHLTTVYAYRDDGYMSDLTRWKPRKVYCTEKRDHSDKPGTLHVVKFRQQPHGCAALISEVVCGELIRLGGLRVLEARLVEVGRGFAGSYETKTEVSYTVTEGLHFGTKLLKGVENGPPLLVEDLADPQELIDLWAFDSWLCTIDRVVEGNILLSLGENGKFNLIAADQSDCFGGAAQFATGRWKHVLESYPAAETLAFADRAIYEAGGACALDKSVAKVRASAVHIRRAITMVPMVWWNETSIDRGELERALEKRSRSVGEILNVRRWKDVDDATRGGTILEFKSPEEA